MKKFILPALAFLAGAIFATSDSGSKMIGDLKAKIGMK